MCLEGNWTFKPSSWQWVLGCWPQRNKIIIKKTPKPPQKPTVLRAELWLSLIPRRKRCTPSWSNPSGIRNLSNSWLQSNSYLIHKPGYGLSSGPQISHRSSWYPYGQATFLVPEQDSRIPAVCQNRSLHHQAPSGRVAGRHRLELCQGLCYQFNKMNYNVPVPRAIHALLFLVQNHSFWNSSLCFYKKMKLILTFIWKKSWV